MTKFRLVNQRQTSPIVYVGPHGVEVDGLVADIVVVDAAAFCGMYD